MTKYIQPPRSEECEWRSGPPPEIGWWPASTERQPHRLRFWNGRHWSSYATSSANARTAGEYGSRMSSDDQDRIKWTDRWWLK